MIQTEMLTKCYGQKKALDRVDFSLSDGHIFGLVGTNGAGKSTMLRLMSGILRPTTGKVLLNHTDISTSEAARTDVCYISDEPSFIFGATIRDMHRMQQAYYPNQDETRLRLLCERFSLPMDERIAGFSKGTQKRVQIVLALSHHPKVLLCDETFDGLDPVMRATFKTVLAETVLDESMITILAGHSLQELEDICDSVGFLHEGRLITSGSMEHVLSEYCKIQIALPAEPDTAMFSDLHLIGMRKQGHLAVLTLRENEETALTRLERLSPVFLESIPLSLEEVFILEMEEVGYAKLV